MDEVPKDPAPLDVNASMRTMNLGQQEQARRKSIIIQRAREGYSIGEQCVLAGIDRRTHSDYRNDDSTFLLDWQAATDEFNRRRLERRRIARGRDMHRAEQVAVGVEAQLQVVTKMFSLEGQVAPTAALQAQADEDPQGFAVKAAMAAKISREMDAKAFGLDEKENVEADAPAQRNADAVTVRDADAFLFEDVGLRRADDSLYRRIAWTFRRADSDPRVRRIVLCMGKGSGKGYAASLRLARRLQRVLACPTEDLSRVYRAGATPRIGVINLSASGGDQAELALFTDLRRWLAGPWFVKFGAPTRETSHLIEWALPDRTGIAFCGNSRSEGAEGIHFVAAGADEVCRLPEEEHGKVLSADALVAPVEATMLTRSGAASELIVASWPDHRGDYLHREVEKARKAGVLEDLTASFLAEPCSWDPTTETTRREAFSAAPFCEFPTEVFLSVDGTLVVWCPLWEVKPNADAAALRAFFDREPIKFAAMVGARPVAQGQFPFFRDPAIIRQNANPKRAHPIGDDGKFLDWFRGSGEFLYYAHIDGALGKTGGDSAGLCVGHWDQGRVVVDLALEMRGPGGGELQLEEIRQVLYAMMGRGFTFAGATCDGFEGFSMRQELASHGIPAEHLSVDKTREPYENLRDAIQTGKVDYYAYDPLFANVDSLVDTGKKIDHTSRGAKDVSDAVAAVVHVLVTQFGGGSTIGSIS